MAKKTNAENAEEILQLKISLYNKLMHLERHVVTPEEINIMFELSRDKKLLAWIDEKLYGKAGG